MLPLVVFLALHASRSGAMWAALALGAALDLTAAGVSKDSVVLGPHALGYALVAYCTLLVRGSVMRRNPLSMMLFSLLGGIMAAIVVSALYMVRSKLDSGMPGFSAMGKFWALSLCALYTLVSAGVLWFPLRLLTPYFGFEDPLNRRRMS